MTCYKFNRSLSPHLFLYKSHITSIMSIFHRITGFLCGLFIFFYFSFFLLLCSLSSYCFVYSSYCFSFMMINPFFFILSFLFFYHMTNGIRHILWDFSLGLNMYNITTTGFLIFSFCLLFVCLMTIL